MSDQLLRTLAAVPVQHRILDVGGGAHTIALVRLGFDLDVCVLSRGVGEALRTRLERVPHARWRMVEATTPAACGYPNAFFDWIVALRVLPFDGRGAPWLPFVKALRELLKPGGWLYVAVSVPQGPDQPDHAERGRTGSSVEDALDEVMAAAGLAVAQEPAVTGEGTARLVEAIYRRVEIDTPV